MKNFEKYEKEIQEGLKNDLLYNVLYELSNGLVDGDKGCDAYDVIEWLYEEYKEPLLTDEERNYLKAVIGPFRHKVVRLDDEIFNLKIVFYDGKYISIPKYGMFKGLNAINGQSYSLEELGL